MFSTQNTASLYQLRNRIADIVVPNLSHPKIKSYAFSIWGDEYDDSVHKWLIPESIFKLSVLDNEDWSLVSSSGEVLKASDLFLEYLDVSEDHPVRTEYLERSGGSEWLFLEHPTFLISLRDWDDFGGKMLLGKGLINDHWVSRIADQVRPFVGWSLCVPNFLLPKELKCLFPILSMESRERKEKRKLGRKPTGARMEYFQRYPEGKPDGLTYEAIAAELTAAGYPISSRSIQNYENERNNSPSVIS